ncbi:hypothetical protein FACS1894162_7400 [Bacteroidia bacterium]|nr:hypothetical protein FACS1894162_7400 [Bacteroidia bacterium]
MVNKKEAKELKALIDEESKFLEFYVRYEEDVIKMSSKREWEIEVDECLDHLIIYYRRLKG